MERHKSGDVLSSRQNTHSEVPCHRHDHEGCEHDHCAEEVFDTVTIRTSRKCTTAELKSYMYKVEHDLSGTVLRAKGIVQGTNGYLDLQYVPGDLKITGSSAAGDILCFIGKNLSRHELTALFDGK